MTKTIAVRAMCTLAASVALASITGTAAGAPLPKKMVLRVFLADFDDVPHPERYSREYFEELLFGLDGPRQTPEGRALSGSVREYFLNLSEGRLDVEGEVEDWVRIPRSITKIPHWKRGMKPFGESWPVIVAETLRAHGILGEGARERVRLRDGRMPDLLVFLNTDWGTGAVNRGWGRLKEVLDIMNLGDLWDDAWPELPSPYSSYSATKWRNAPRSAPDGTIDRIPADSELEMFPLSVMMHEMGHQLAGWPDLYAPAYEPWGVFDLMGGPAASTHFPMSVSAYLRVRSGWMQYTDMPRQSAPALALRPLDTHKEAFRFPQGPWQESIIAENRWCLKYPRDYGEPPTNEGPRLLLYRLDPAGRRRMMYSGSPRQKITTHIRRPEHYGEVWGEGEFTEVTAETTPSSRNSLGELWWEFRDIRPGPDDEVRFDAHFAAADLIEDYMSAEWTDQDGGRVEAGRFGRSGGHVCVRSTAADGALARCLHIGTGPGGSIRGRYGLPAGGPRRLYVTASVPDGAGSPVALTIAPAVGEATEAQLPTDTAGQRHTVIADLPSAADGVELVVQALTEATPASVSIHEAWLVGLPEAVSDLVGTAPAWTPSPAEPAAAPRTMGAIVLYDGCTYGPAVLTLPVGGGAPNKWRAEWPVTVPEPGAMLRAVIGLGAEAVPGSKAKVSLKLIGAEHEWQLTDGLEVAAYEPERDDRQTTRSNLPAVVEAALPKEMSGKEGKVAMEVTGTGEQQFRVAVPYLRLCLQ